MKQAIREYLKSEQYAKNELKSQVKSIKMFLDFSFNDNNDMSKFYLLLKLKEFKDAILIGIEKHYNS